MDSLNKGFFITFEGIDGSGKSTQIKLLEKWLVDNYSNEVVCTYEPGKTESGEVIREVILHGKNINPRAEMLLYAANRAIHVDSLLEPAIKENKIVISDRYVDSSIAYQAGGCEIDIEKVKSVNYYATKGITPDLTFLFDCSYKDMMSRLDRELDNLESRAVEFFDRTRQMYLELANQGKSRWIVLDATKSIDEIHNEIITAVKDKFSSYLK